MACRGAVRRGCEFVDRPFPLWHACHQRDRQLLANADVEVKLTSTSGSTIQHATACKDSASNRGRKLVGFADSSNIGHTEGERLRARRHLEGAGGRLVCSLAAAVSASRSSWPVGIRPSRPLTASGCRTTEVIQEAYGRRGTQKRQDRQEPSRRTLS